MPRACLLMISVLLPGALQAEPISLFQDVPTRSADRGSEPATFVVLGETAYFVAADDPHGRELWRTDGTAAGTFQVADVCPGRCSSQPYPFAVLTATDERLFFVADDGVTGSELWTSDGTAAGTRQVLDLCPGRCSGAIFELTAVGDRVFFSGSDGTVGLEPFVSDGTAAGSRQLCPACTDPAGSTPAGWIAFEGRAFFTAHTPETGTELWSSDGTPEGTGIVADLCPGACNSFVRLLHVFGGKLFFGAETIEHGGALWTSDGTAAGTTLFAELVPGSAGVALDTALEHDGLLYVAGVSFGAPVCGGRFRCVWRTDGTPQGTAVAQELFAQTSTEISPSEMLSAGSSLYWVQNVETSTDYELWVYDGVERRRLLVADGVLLPLLGLPGGRLIFSSHGSPSRIWVSDGTAAGTLPVAGTEPRTSFYTKELRGVILDGHAIFTAGQGNRDYELWRSDGTAAGTALLHELRARRSLSEPRELFALGEKVLFLAGELFDSDLWVSDSTTAGTAILAQGAGGRGYARLGDRVFAADFQGTGKLWTTDGTTAGTTEVPGVRFPGSELVPLGDAVYFSGGLEGEQLWRSDGTAAGTRLVKDLNPDFFLGGPGVPIPSPIALPRSLTVADGMLYMVGFQSNGEAELWRSDGTTAGTILLKRFERDPVFEFLLESGPREIAPLGGRLLFAAYSAAEGCELWVSDGTAAGTRLLADLAAGSASSRPGHFTVLNSRVFFTARRSDGHEELWRSDGTAAGTVRVGGFSATEVSLVSAVSAVGGRLFLSVWTPSTGAEPWVSDGTAVGTRQVRDLLPGPRGSAPGEFLPLPDGRVLFAASDADHGRELWVSDGTAVGTLLVEDLAPGAAAASPEELTRLGDRVVFAADDTDDRKLFAVKVTDLPSAPAAPCRTDRLCLHDGRFEVGVVWRDFQGNTGPGRVVPGLDSDDSGLFWFFDPANYEFLVKVLDGCGFNGRFWVLAAATTNVEYTLTVTDTTTGVEAIYSNALGRSSPAIIDVEAFDDCP